MLLSNLNNSTISFDASVIINLLEPIPLNLNLSIKERGLPTSSNKSALFFFELYDKFLITVQY